MTTKSQLLSQVIMLEATVNQLYNSLSDDVMKEHPLLVTLSIESICHRIQDLANAIGELEVEK